MVVTYRQPQDEVAFDRDYFGIHAPMTKRLPGLRRYVVSKAHPAGPRVEDEYLIATLDFDSLEAINAARASDVGQACMRADSRIEIVGAPNESQSE
jgi:uncharacterized protein (TIGR02118 family)